MFGKQPENPRFKLKKNGSPVICAEIFASLLTLSAMAHAAVEDSLETQAAPHGAEVLNLVQAPNCISLAKIEEMEKAFLAFGDFVLEHMNEHVADPEMLKKIEHVFKIMRDNKQKPRCSEFKTVVPFGKENGFSYQFVSSAKRAAAFAGKYRVMQVPPDFDYRDKVKLVDLVHELAHVAHDDWLRISVLESRYMDVYSSPFMIAVLEDEAEAISLEAEVANVLSGGALKAAALAGRAADLGTKDAAAQKYLNAAARVYFGKPQEFAAFIEKSYRNTPGVLIFDRSLRRVP